MQIGTVSIQPWLVLVLFFSTMIFITFLVMKNKLKFFTNKFGIELGGSTKKNKVVELISILSELDELKIQTFATKFYEMTSLQMKFAEDQFLLINSIQQDAYIKVYFEKNPTEKIQANKDFLFFQLIFERVKDKILSELRRHFIDNGLSEKDNEEFFNYKRDLVETIMQQMRTTIAQWYNIIDGIVTSGELFREIGLKSKEVEDILYKIIDNAKEVSNKKINEIIEMNKRREDILLKRLGGEDA